MAALSNIEWLKQQVKGLRARANPDAGQTVLTATADRFEAIVAEIEGAKIHGVAQRHATDDRYTVCLYFQDLETGAFHTVYPQGLGADEVMAILADPAKQFAPVPPPPTAPPPPQRIEE